MGNNVNGKLHWHGVMKPHEKLIKDAFIFHDKFAKKADKIFAKIRHVITQGIMMNRGRNKDLTTQKEKAHSSDIAFVGVHIR